VYSKIGSRSAVPNLLMVFLVWSASAYARDVQYIRFCMSYNLNEQSAQVYIYSSFIPLAYHYF